MAICTCGRNIPAAKIDVLLLLAFFFYSLFIVPLPSPFFPFFLRSVSALLPFFCPPFSILFLSLTDRVGIVRLSTSSLYRILLPYPSFLAALRFGLAKTFTFPPYSFPSFPSFSPSFSILPIAFLTAFCMTYSGCCVLSI